MSQKASSENAVKEPKSGALTRANLKAYTTARRREHAHKRGQKFPSPEVDWEDYRSVRSWVTPPGITAEMLQFEKQFDIEAIVNEPTILRELIEDAPSPRASLAQAADAHSKDRAGDGQEATDSARPDSFYWYRPRNWAASQPEESPAGQGSGKRPRELPPNQEADEGTKEAPAGHEAVEKPARPFPPPPDLDPDPAKPPFASRDTDQEPAWPSFPSVPDAGTDYYTSGPKYNPFSHRLPNNRPDIPRRQPPPEPQPTEWPSSRAPQPNFPPSFPAYHCTQNMNEIAAYLANASYVASLAGPPLADLKYGVIIVPAGEEALLFGRSPDFVISKEFIDAVDDANRDYDRALRMHDPDRDSAEFVRRRFDDDFASVEVEAQRNVEVGVPEGGGEDGEGLRDDVAEGQEAEDAEAPGDEDEKGAGIKGLEAVEVGDVEDPEERQSKRQRRCQ